MLLSPRPFRAEVSGRAIAQPVRRCMTHLLPVRPTSVGRTDLTSQGAPKKFSPGELNDFSPNTATHGLAPQAESHRSRLSAFSRDFRGFLAPDLCRRFSLVRRDHSGSEREPRGYVRTPNVSRKNSRALAIETTNGLTALSSPLLSGVEGGREDSSAPPQRASASFRTPTWPNRFIRGGGLHAMYTFTCRG